MIPYVQVVNDPKKPLPVNIVSSGLVNTVSVANFPATQPVATANANQPFYKDGSMSVALSLTPAGALRVELTGTVNPWEGVARNIWGGQNYGW